ncbi:MAG: hypothetical protein JW843_11785 [Candidatus Aminicenantes bacterium]|nr:hypothetical protein [Candidatus Aminicenantes bacterium]
MKRFRIVFSVLVLAASYSAADTLSLSFSHNATDNLFQTRFAEADAVTAAGLTWEKALSEFSLLAGAEGFFLHENTGMSLVSFSGGVDYLKSLGEKSALYVSLIGDTSLYRAEYSDFNRTGLRFMAALKTYLSPSSILKATAVSEYRSYRYDPFDFFSQSLSLSIDQYFPSRTTLQAEFGWGYKYFIHPQTVIAGESEIPAAAATSSLGSAVAMGYGGKGQGGSGERPGWEAYAPVSASAEGKGLQTASLQARLGQGLGDRVGLRLAGIVQWNLSGVNPFTTVDEYMMVENPTYDAFAWEGTGWNAQLSLLLPWNIEARLGYNRTDKSFPGIESRDLLGNALGSIREDGRDQVDVKVEKNFGRWSLVLTYAFIRNRSNDPLFDWSGRFISGGFQWNFDLGEK